MTCNAIDNTVACGSPDLHLLAIHGRWTVKCGRGHEWLPLEGTSLSITGFLRVPVARAPDTAAEAVRELLAASAFNAAAAGHWADAEQCDRFYAARATVEQTFGLGGTVPS